MLLRQVLYVCGTDSFIKSAIVTLNREQQKTAFRPIGDSTPELSAL